MARIFVMLLLLPGRFVHPKVWELGLKNSLCIQISMGERKK